MLLTSLFVLSFLLFQDHIKCDSKISRVVRSRVRRWATGFDEIFPPGVWSAKQAAMAEMIGGILDVTAGEEGPLVRLLLGLARSVAPESIDCLVFSNSYWLTQSW